MYECALICHNRKYNFYTFFLYFIFFFIDSLSNKLKIKIFE